MKIHELLDLVRNGFKIEFVKPGAKMSNLIHNVMLAMIRERLIGPVDTETILGHRIAGAGLLEPSDAGIGLILVLRRGYADDVDVQRVLWHGNRRKNFVGAAGDQNNVR